MLRTLGGQGNPAATGFESDRSPRVYVVGVSRSTYGKQRNVGAVERAMRLLEYCGRDRKEPGLPTERDRTEVGPRSFRSRLSANGSHIHRSTDGL